MTDRKRTEKDKAPAKRKKLQLNKETLKDLSVKKGASPKGGAEPLSRDTCVRRTGCGDCESRWCT